ncbi:hypothetical protein CMI45_00440 [Candidatus Pacearchaeota archaeon]|nr:hypothetical protein [Candidatus Pacearchaeota archaeon]|tara:strand:- start:843 stop:1145 length:303 start_codon:yes stop_codon:yes gene_type:complete
MSDDKNLGGRVYNLTVYGRRNPDDLRDISGTYCLRNGDGYVCSRSSHGLASKGHDNGWEFDREFDQCLSEGDGSDFSVRAEEIDQFLLYFSRERVIKRKF